MNSLQIRLTTLLLVFGLGACSSPGGTSSTGGAGAGGSSAAGGGAGKTSGAAGTSGQTAGGTTGATGVGGGAGTGAVTGTGGAAGAGGSGTGGAGVTGGGGTGTGVGGGAGTGAMAGAGGHSGTGGGAGTGAVAGAGGHSGTGGGAAGAGGSPAGGTGGGAAGMNGGACPNTPTAPGGACAVTAALQQVPALPRNACNNASLPQAWGTNFLTPTDPSGWGTDTTAMGWEGNYWPTFEYSSGSFFARGVGTSTYKLTSGTSSGTSVCGAMYSFGLVISGGTPATGAVQWSMDSNYLPAFTTSLTRGNLAISVKNFEDKVTIGGHDFGLVYSRVTVKNNGTASASGDPQPSAGLAALTSNSTTVAAGQSMTQDYVVAVDDFGSGTALPTGTALTGAAPSYDTAYAQMTAYWNGRLTAIPTLQLPNITLPNTNLANPGTELSNAFKANFVYTRIVQVGKAPFSGANNYAWLLNHDLPHILANRFTLGDFQDAQNLMLAGRVSEESGFPNNGANWYLDGLWKTPWQWAIYLAKTGDTAFVKQYFNDTSTTWGPSLYNLMHQIPGQIANGYLKSSNDNDSQGTWLFDDYSAIMGLAAYKYIATEIGNATEATWADGQITSLVAGTNTGLTSNEQNNNFTHLPCEVNVPPVAGNPPTGDRCGTAADANWASAAFNGQDAWDAFLEGANLTGLIADPAQTDALYDWGFGRLTSAVPYPSMGGYPGYSTADNTGYAEGGLYGTKYRDLAITSYAWQIETTTGGPYSWWEDNGVGPVTTDPWAGNHASPKFGACPYAWPMAAQSLSLIDAIAAEGLSATASGSTFTFTRPLYIGRGIPNAWIAAGQTISIDNLTNNFNMGTCARSTYGVSIGVAGSPRVVTVTLCGSLPGGAILVQLPIFSSVGVASVVGGSYSSTTETVTVTPGTTTVTITLKS